MGAVRAYNFDCFEAGYDAGYMAAKVEQEKRKKEKRQRQLEKRIEKVEIAKKRATGIAIIAISLALLPLMEGDATATVFLCFLGTLLIFERYEKERERTGKREEKIRKERKECRTQYRKEKKQKKRKIAKRSCRKWQSFRSSK